MKKILVLIVFFAMLGFIPAKADNTTPVVKSNSTFETKKPSFDLYAYAEKPGRKKGGKKGGKGKKC